MDGKGGGGYGVWAYALGAKMKNANKLGKRMNECKCPLNPFPIPHFPFISFIHFFFQFIHSSNRLLASVAAHWPKDSFTFPQISFIAVRQPFVELLRICIASSHSSSSFFLLFPFILSILFSIFVTASTTTGFGLFLPNLSSLEYF